MNHKKEPSDTQYRTRTTQDRRSISAAERQAVLMLSLIERTRVFVEVRAGYERLQFQDRGACVQCHGRPARLAGRYTDFVHFVPHNCLRMPHRLLLKGSRTVSAETRHCENSLFFGRRMRGHGRSHADRSPKLSRIGSHCRNSSQKSCD